MARKPPADKGADSGNLPVVVGRVPQPHGGALNTGGTPGNRGGGNTPSVLRGRMREILEKAMKMLEDISLGRVSLELTFNCPACGWQAQKKAPFVPRSSDITKAIDICARYGLGVPPKAYDEELVNELAAATALVLDTHADGQVIADALKEAWLPVLAKRKEQAG